MFWDSFQILDWWFPLFVNLSEFSKVWAMSTEKTPQDLWAWEVRWYHETTSIRREINKWHQKGLNNTKQYYFILILSMLSTFTFGVCWMLRPFELRLLNQYSIQQQVWDHQLHHLPPKNGIPRHPNLNAGLGIPMFTEIEGNNLRRHIGQPSVKLAQRQAQSHVDQWLGRHAEHWSNIFLVDRLSLCITTQNLLLLDWSSIIILCKSQGTASNIRSVLRWNQSPESWRFSLKCKSRKASTGHQPHTSNLASENSEETK